MNHICDFPVAPHARQRITSPTTFPPPMHNAIFFMYVKGNACSKATFWVTFTGEVTLFVKCVSLRKVEKMLSLSALWCAMQQVGEQHRKELLCGNSWQRCVNVKPGGKESVWISVRGCVGASVWGRGRQRVWLHTCMCVSIRERCGDLKNSGIYKILWGSVWMKNRRVIINICAEECVSYLWESELGTR